MPANKVRATTDEWTLVMAANTDATTIALARPSSPVVLSFNAAKPDADVGAYESDPSLELGGTANSLTLAAGSDVAIYARAPNGTGAADLIVLT